MENSPMEKILIVDDDHQVCALLSRILSKENRFTCHVARDAREARDLLAQHEFHLVMSDIQMPGESGLSLVKYIRQTYSDMAVILASVIEDPKEVKTAMELGLQGYILKPFDPRQVLITVVNALRLRQLTIRERQHGTELKQQVEEKTCEARNTIHKLAKAQAEQIKSVKGLHDHVLFLQTLMDAIPIPVFYKDHRGVFVGCNEAFEEILGIARDKIIGKTVGDIAPKDLADEYSQSDQKLMHNPGKITFETRFRNGDGIYRDVIITKATYKDSTRDTAGTIGALIDTTDRKQNERALRLSEEKNRRILDNLGIGVAMISPDMHLLEMNKKMRRWFPSTKLQDQRLCYQLFFDPPGERPCDFCPVVATLKDGKAHEANIQKPKDGRTFNYRLVTSPILDSDDKVVAVIELVEDTTKKHALERELLQAQKLASIGQLAAGVAHEINNPTGFVSSNLITLSGYQDDVARLLTAYQELKKSLQPLPADCCLPEIAAQVEKIEALEAEIDIDYIQSDVAELIGDCREGTERIKKIVEDLKHFAHPGQDKVQETDLNKELESTLNVVHNELKYKATVVKEFGELPIISANPQQLNQVFINILVNAAQAIEKMGEIRIRTEQVNGHVQVRISDTGCGIEAQNLSKIFDPFFTTKEVGKGTGLGMNIAYNIVKKHGGDIQVESQLGVGSAFTIRLPIGSP
jgi:two-component system NtrC family sensor kinase